MTAVRSEILHRSDLQLQLDKQLRDAAFAGKVDSVRKLIADKADPNLTIKFSESQVDPLLLCIADKNKTTKDSRCLEIMRELIKGKADVNGRDHFNIRIVMRMAADGCTHDAFKILLENGVDLTGQICGQVLFLTRDRGEKAAFEKMIEESRNRPDASTDKKD